MDYVRARRGGFLPVGIRAWLSGMLAFAMFAGLYVIFLPMVDNDSFPFGGVRDFYIMVLASIPASAVFARLVLGGSERTFPESPTEKPLNEEAKTGTYHARAKR